MNYLKAYVQLIRKAETARCLDGYVEKHHVFPVSIFGENSRIVELTYREHFVAHLLLARFYESRYGNQDERTRKMKCAVGLMTITSKDERLKNSRYYDVARRMLRDSKLGKERPDMKGKRYFGASEETIADLTRRQSDARRGKHTNYPKKRKPLSGRTPEVFKKISDSRKQTLERYKRMSEVEFWDWIHQQNKFTKVAGRKDRPNVNITRAMVARGVPLSNFFNESDFGDTWFKQPKHREQFYGLRDSLIPNVNSGGRKDGD